MRKQMFVALSLIVLASLALAACGSATPTPLSSEELTNLIEQGVEKALQTAQAATQVAAPTLTPTKTPTPTAIQLTATPVSTSTPNGEELMGTVEAVVTASGPQLRTAEDIRTFGRVIGWVTGGSSGEFVQGAQIALKSDFLLKTLPEGDVFEFECVHYTVINGEVNAKPVCDGALIRFSTNSVVPAGSIGTLWLSHAVVGSETEQWEEGFLNLPCKCADGDCRD